jgi:aryl-alcohol dehydrogenase-like predicted oxidoreductase
MQFTFLGRSGLSVSRLVLGTNNFGSFADESESVAMMDTALELGINLFGIGVIPYSPSSGGLLAGVLRKSDKHRSGERGLPSQGITMRYASFECYRVRCLATKRKR